MKNKGHEEQEMVEISIKCSESFAEKMGNAIIDSFFKQGQMSALTALTGVQLLTEKHRNDRLN